VFNKEQFKVLYNWHAVANKAVQKAMAEKRS